MLDEYFSPEKNKQLIDERRISFEEAVGAILSGEIIDIINHPNKAKYLNQKIYIVNIDNYAYAVPFIRENTTTVFLKTIFPTKKLTKKYLQEKNNG